MLTNLCFIFHLSNCDIIFGTEVANRFATNWVGLMILCKKSLDNAWITCKTNINECNTNYPECFKCLFVSLFPLVVAITLLVIIIYVILVAILCIAGVAGLI